MTDSATNRKRGNSKPNVKKRGSTYTYYVYVTGPDGGREQHSKGGFKTQREAEEARVTAAHALATGSYVKAERISLADFLIDEWLPSRPAAGAGGEHMAFVRQIHAAARDPAHRRRPIAETVAG